MLKSHLFLSSMKRAPSPPLPTSWLPSQTAINNRFGRPNDLRGLWQAERPVLCGGCCWLAGWRDAAAGWLYSCWFVRDSVYAKRSRKYLKIITISEMPFVQPFRKFKSRVYSCTCTPSTRHTTCSGGGDERR